MLRWPLFGGEEALQAIQVKCPNCAAVLRVSADAMTVDCDYCHTQSHVQRRTRMLQMPIKMPPPPRRGVPMRAARQVVRRSMVAVSVIGALIPFGAFGAVFLAMRGQFEQAAEVVKGALATGASGSSAAAGRGRAGRADRGDGSSWVGISAPLFADVDADGVSDVLGRVRYVGSGDRAHLVALSGATGKRLWQSPTIGSYGDTIQSRTSVVGDLVLFANATGALSAFELSSGETRFAASLPDRGERLCRKGEDAIVVQAADRSWHQIALADGAARKVRKEARCDRLVHDERESIDPGVAVDTSPRRASQAGMRVERELRRGGGRAVGVGWRSRGTAVPMVAGLDGRGRIAWKAEVPDGRPLEASQGRGGLWTVTGALVCGTYQRTRSPTHHHVTCFGLDDGERAWDVELVGVSMPLTSLVSSGERIYLSGWGLLLGIDGATGDWLPGLGL